jgi:hypothetical protein
VAGEAHRGLTCQGDLAATLKAVRGHARKARTLMHAALTGLPAFEDGKARAETDKELEKLQAALPAFLEALRQTVQPLPDERPKRRPKALPARGPKMLPG